MTLYSVTRSEETLEHHGVKGQKWGVKKAAKAYGQGTKDSFKNASRNITHPTQQAAAVGRAKKKLYEGHLAKGDSKVSAFIKTNLQSGFNTPKFATTTRKEADALIEKYSKHKSLA